MKTALIALMAVYLSSCSVRGGLGSQCVNPFDPRNITTNNYECVVGELVGTVNVADNFYLSATHISGVNTAEDDGGLNYVSAGFLVEFQQ